MSAAPIRTDFQPASEDERLRAQLEETWRQPPGLWNWIRSVDHKSIAKRYLVTAFCFFILGGIEAGVIY